MIFRNSLALILKASFYMSCNNYVSWFKSAAYSQNKMMFFYLYCLNKAILIDTHNFCLYRLILQSG